MKSTVEAGARAERTRTNRLAGFALLVLAVATLVVVAGTLALWRKKSELSATEDARVDALAAAQSDIKDLLSYDYKTMDHDLAAATRHMTPRMARNYTAYWRGTLEPAAVKTRTQVLTQPQSGGVMSAKPDEVEVVLFVKMLSVNAVRKDPQVDANRLRLEMKKVHGTWLVDGPLVNAQRAAPSESPSEPAVGPTASPRPGRR